MSAKDNLRVIHTVDGATLTNLYGKARISSKDIGLISLTTGKIVMADPTRRFQIEDFTRKAFSRKVEPGIICHRLYCSFPKGPAAGLCRNSIFKPKAVFIHCGQIDL